MAQTSAAKRREGIDEVAARGVLGTRGVVAEAVQSWVRPEADPPSGCVRQRGSCKWEGPSSRMTHFSTTNFTNFHEWETASTEILLFGLARVHSFICGSRTSEQDGRKARFGHR